jgi:alginate O-acetyltransferase complex protein AlgI
MIFSSPLFLLLFLPLVLAGSYFTRGRLQNYFLLAVSLVFYAWGEPRFVFILMGTIVFNYLFAILINRIRKGNLLKRLIVALAIIANIALLINYKYLADLLPVVNSLTRLNLPIHKIILPLGISFFTFQSISYVFDVYYQVVKVEKNIINVGLYIVFFPKLLSGPIVLYNTISEQIRNRSTSLEKFATGVRRFIIGLAKKVILSAPLGVIADQAFSHQPGAETILLSWVGIIAYTLQLYFDFSGYSDMAIGLGKMFGFDLPENFDYPYTSRSRAGYWQRWHISLSAWFRDYLYTPLFRGLMNITNPLTKKTLSIKSCDLISLFVTWLLVGIWHGSGLQFVVYGLWWFFFIMIERLYTAYSKKKDRNKENKGWRSAWWYNALMHIYTLLVILFGLVFFRSSSLDYAFNYIKNMVGLNSYVLYDNTAFLLIKQNLLFLVFGIIFSLPVWQFVKNKVPYFQKETAVTSIIFFIGYVGLFVISIGYVVSSTPKAFLYFQF